jgi:hypothetical protein
MEQSWKLTKEKSYDAAALAKVPKRFNRGDLSGAIGAASKTVSTDGKTKYVHAPTYKGLDISDSLNKLAPTESRYWKISKAGSKINVQEFTKSSSIPEELSTCKVLKTHDDGDLTLKCKDAKYIVTTDGKTFKEVRK